MSGLASLHRMVSNRAVPRLLTLGSAGYVNSMGNSRSVEAEMQGDDYPTSWR